PAGAAPAPPRGGPRRREIDSQCVTAPCAAVKSAPVDSGVASGDGGVTLVEPAANAPGPRCCGGASPNVRYTRPLAQRQETTMPEAVRVISTGRDQKPIALCQFQSRALPRA